jgi:hypothetical protein
MLARVGNQIVQSIGRTNVTDAATLLGGEALEVGDNLGERLK